MQLSNKDIRIMDMALYRYQSYCYRRAEQIAQDSFTPGIDPAWVGKALDEGKAAGELLLRLRAESAPSCRHKWTFIGAPRDPFPDQICEGGCGQTYAAVMATDSK